MKIAVYGATGHTGGHLTAELLRRGTDPALVGRDSDRLRSLARDTRSEMRIATLDDHEALVAAFTGVDAVISSLPAYVEHGASVLAAAIAAGTHYVDLSGEQLWLKRAFDDFGPAAREAGVAAVPGITDSNLPGDLLANLAARRIDGPADIVISHRTRSGGEGSRGSARTLLASLDWFRSGGWHYQDERLRRGPLDRHTTMLFPGDTEETAVTKFPQPPVLTIPRHTPVRFVSGVLDVNIHAAVGAMTPDLVDTLPEAPSATADMRYDLVVDAVGSDGVTVRAVLSGVDSYRDSALMAVTAATALVENATVNSGVLAAAEAFTPRAFLDALVPHGITWRIEEPVRR
ncbi:saccharopine dehydrogenase NADP-binding domain-containing protein [Nocardia flavorosea]|uniref:NAD(P)H-binding protein n=1 Tax=Nocardia flavorosea TaxID=53429 RepID=A0A846YS72_9NOCA|nr:saccharopine dehydrogenase NADP-binding domain-containing protein [Nocardia flavorosea]NKY60278.1 NAD(P)H-binding protein [Nocardia flavorosea]